MKSVSLIAAAVLLLQTQTSAWSLVVIPNAIRESLPALYASSSTLHRTNRPSALQSRYSSCLFYRDDGHCEESTATRAIVKKKHKLLQMVHFFAVRLTAWLQQKEKRNDNQMETLKVVRNNSRNETTIANATVAASVTEEPMLPSILHNGPKIVHARPSMAQYLPPLRSILLQRPMEGEFQMKATTDSAVTVTTSFAPLHSTTRKSIDDAIVDAMCTAAGSLHGTVSSLIETAPPKIPIDATLATTKVANDTLEAVSSTIHLKREQSDAIINESTQYVSSKVSVPVNATATSPKRSYSPFGVIPKAVPTTNKISIPASLSNASAKHVPAEVSLPVIATIHSVKEESDAFINESAKYVSPKGSVSVNTKSYAAAIEIKSFKVPTMATDRSNSSFESAPQGPLKVSVPVNTTATASKKSYAPFEVKPKAVPTTFTSSKPAFLSNESAKQAPLKVSQPETAITSKRSYAPFGVKPKAVPTTFGNFAPLKSYAHIAIKPDAKPTRPMAPVIRSFPKATTDISAKSILFVAPVNASASTAAILATPASSVASDLSFSNTTFTANESIKLHSVAASVRTLTTATAPKNLYRPFGVKPKAVRTSGFLATLSTPATARLYPKATKAPLKAKTVAPAVSSTPAVTPSLPTKPDADSSLLSPICKVGLREKSFSPFGLKSSAINSSGFLDHLPLAIDPLPSNAYPAAPVQRTKYTPFGKNLQTPASSDMLNYVSPSKDAVREAKATLDRIEKLQAYQKQLVYLDHLLRMKEELRREENTVASYNEQPVVSNSYSMSLDGSTESATSDFAWSGRKYTFAAPASKDAPYYTEL
jgi:archaellum component FlaF (FlaF/FlaG flagellin family)